MRSKLNRPGRGFTLVELLVVIGIISILAGLLMPALEQAIESGRTIRCASNLKQIGIAQQSYLEDHRYYFFPASVTGMGYWCQPGSSNYFVTPYMGIQWEASSAWCRPGIVLDCPTNIVGLAGWRYVDYAPNDTPTYYPGPGYGGYGRVSAMRCNPSRFITFADANIGGGSITTLYYGSTRPATSVWDNSNLGNIISYSGRPAGVEWCHMDKANCAYLDAHVKASGVHELTDDHWNAVP